MEIKSVSNEVPPLSLGEIFQEVLDKAAIAVITDLHDTITFVNDNFCRVSKYSREELIGKNFRILKSGYHSDAFYQEIRDSVSTGKTWTGQIKNQAKDGGVYWIQTTVVPILSPNGTQVQYLSFGIDITSQKAAMEEVAKIREHFYILANNFPNGYISLIDTDLRILFSGGSEERKKGQRDPESVIGKPINEVLSGETASTVIKSLPQVLTGKTVIAEIHSKGKSYQSTLKPIFEPDGSVSSFVLVVQDITEVKKMALEAKKNNDLFSVIARTGSWEWDVKTGEVIFSLNAASLLGIEDPEYRDGFDGILERVHPDDREGFRRETQLFIAEGKPFDWEFRIIKSGGEIRFMETSSIIYKNDQGQAFRMIGVIKDVTDKMEKERELVENKEILENIADNLPGMVMRYAEHPDGRKEILYVSKGVEKLLEVPQEEIVADADSISERLAKDEVAGFYRSIGESRKNLSMLDIEHKVVMDDGRIKWINFTGMPKRTREGVIIWNIMALDVTDRRRVEELVEKNMEILSFQNKQLLDFCNIVSHNLRSPLINLSMLIGFIEESRTEEEKRGFVEKMKPVIENLNETFEELVESIQIKQDVEIASEKIPIAAYFQKMVAGFEGQILETGAKLVTDFSAAPEVFFPPKYFSSILHNLISNALKYHAVDRQPEINVFTKREKNGNVLLVVRDNGLGINLQRYGDSLFKMRKVFHRHPDAKGFGLFITKTQVESMNGKIWAESEPGKGSSFFVEFRNR